MYACDSESCHSYCFSCWKVSLHGCMSVCRSVSMSGSMGGICLWHSFNAYLLTDNFSLQICLVCDCQIKSTLCLPFCILDDVAMVLSPCDSRGFYTSRIECCGGCHGSSFGCNVQPDMHLGIRRATAVQRQLWD